MKRLTTNDFIAKAKKIHGNKYDYSKVEYKNAHTKVRIICSEHGEFWQIPNNHLNGNGCPLCIKNYWTTDKFIERAKEIHGDKYDYSKTIFKTVNDKVCIISHDLDRNGKEIGEFWQLPLSHLSGLGCKREQRGAKEECWETRICPICKKGFKVRKKYKKITCSEECLKKYKIVFKDEINAKRSKTLKQKFSLKTQEEIEKEHYKAKQTCLRLYGKESFSQTDEGRKKSSENMKKIRKKYCEKNQKEVLIPKYKEICENDNLELIEFRNRFDCDVRCKKCGNKFNVKVLGYLTETTNKNLCRVCHPIELPKGPTHFEIDFYSFLNELGIKYQKNCRSIITPNEIDFYLPDYRIGFELDGLYWHSELYKDKKYHLIKTESCLKKDVILFHIFEDEWLYKKEICQSMIKNILILTPQKIYARNCIVKEVEKEESMDFINQNHIQGYSPSNIFYGLFYKNKLVSIMTFKHLNMKQKCYKIVNFCSKINIIVIGGASKLLNYFIKENKPQQIITYADKRWSQGHLFDKLGFSLYKETSPDYSYIIGDKRFNKKLFINNQLIKECNYSMEMSKKHWYRIYDCGLKCYKLILNKVC